MPRRTTWRGRPIRSGGAPNLTPDRGILNAIRPRETRLGLPAEQQAGVPTGQAGRSPGQNHPEPACRPKHNRSIPNVSIR